MEKEGEGDIWSYQSELCVRKYMKKISFVTFLKEKCVRWVKQLVCYRNRLSPLAR